ncbi:TetR/AcrR family transcriptional regulator [Microbacterium sp. NPDC060132]|uniref:TetR/AcrR family transcriptional regulator n=1 Tax=unclassified Microbacterium TaxID=2609290 RepID=UPI00365A394B
MPRASAADAAATARRILDTATAHFAAHGYAAASVDDIARAAGVTRGAVYHHYDSKPGLFAAVAAAAQERVASVIATATRDTPGPAALRDGSHAFLDAITAGTAARVLLVDGPAVLGWEQWRRLDAEGPEQELRAGLREAGVPSAQVDALTAALSGAMNELALWLAARPDDTAARRQAHRALDRLLDAVTSAH